MSMRSIDVRNVIVKSKEVEGIQKAQNRVTTTGQQAFEAELSKRAEEKSSTVQSSPETQHEKKSVAMIKGTEVGRKKVNRMRGRSLNVLNQEEMLMTLMEISARFQAK